MHAGYSEVLGTDDVAYTICRYGNWEEIVDPLAKEIGCITHYGEKTYLSRHM
jgi:hypothetical protein